MANRLWNPYMPKSTNIGTPGYMAPELLLGDEYYHFATDIWSVGCIFAEILNNAKGIFKFCYPMNNYEVYAYNLIGIIETVEIDIEDRD